MKEIGENNMTISETIADKIIQKGVIRNTEWPKIDIREIAESTANVANEILPKIIKGFDKSGTHYILLEELVQIYKNLTKEYFSIESMFCGLSIALWPISMDIVINNRYAIVFAFYSPYPQEVEPNTKNCMKIWKDLYETLLEPRMFPKI